MKPALCCDSELMLCTNFEDMPLQIIYGINGIYILLSFNIKECMNFWTSTEIHNRENDAFVLHKIRLERTDFSLSPFGNTAPGPKVVNHCHNSFGSPVKDSSVI